jgi:undecaprenyl-diphosphatase
MALAMISLTEMDRMLFTWINSRWSDPVLDATMPWISLLADGGVVWLWLALAGVLAGLRFARSGGTKTGKAEGRRRMLGTVMRIGLYLALIYGVNSALCHGLKGAIDRPRPFVTDPTVILRVPPQTASHLSQQGSFPSGHAVNAFMLAALLAEWFRRKGYAFYGLAVLIALSRLYLGVHYPSDVLAGGLLGIAATRLMLSLGLLRQRITGEPPPLPPVP